MSEEYIDIVSALLKDRLEYPIIQDLATGVELIEVVRKNNKGLVSMFIADESSSSEELIDPNDLGKLQCLRALVSIKDSSSPVRHVLANKYIAESASVAREMSRRYPHATFGTRDGIVFSEGCIVSGGSTNGDNVLLKRKNELEKFELKYSQTKTLYESASYELDTLRNTLSTKENEIRTLRDTIARCHSEVDTLQEDVHNKKAQALTFEREDELRQLWGRKAEEENIEKGKKVEEAQKHIETLTVEIATLKEHGDQYKKIIDELTREIESERQREKEYLVKKTSLEEKLKNSKEEVQKITTFLQTLLLREKEIQDRIEKGAHELTSVLNEKEAEEKALRELKETLASVQKEFEETEQKLADERVAFEELKKELEEKKQALEQKSQSTNALMLQKERLSMKRDMLTSDCQNKHGINIENYKPEVNMSYSGAKEEEKKLGLYLSKIGEVNVKAIKDYEEILVRFTFLESQKKDLENSLDELERALTKVNKNTVTLFTEAFEKVRINFQENIQKLFPNGSGDLYLSNPDNILESGIDLVIEPKGKSIRNINLLSGGEKALVLICYLISIFYYNPSPFCILDEIDAPLDDTNVDKFVNLVKSLTGKTQFLIISHNKKTMEMSEYLYGITMEEPGISKVVSVDFKGFELEGNA